MNCYQKKIKIIFNILQNNKINNKELIKNIKKTNLYINIKKQINE